jgi:hypothetical protein
MDLIIDRSLDGLSNGRTEVLRYQSLPSVAVAQDFSPAALHPIVQQMPILAQPLARVVVIGAGVRDQKPEMA